MLSTLTVPIIVLVIMCMVLIKMMPTTMLLRALRETLKSNVSIICINNPYCEQHYARL